MSSFEIGLFGIALVCALLAVRMVLDISRRQSELGRFYGKQIRWWNFVAHDIRRYVAYRTAFRTLSNVQHTLTEREVRRLEEAGMSHSQMRFRYFVVREVLLLLSLAASIYFFVSYGALLSAFLMPPIIVLAVWGPRVWLYLRWRDWQHRLEVEQLFLLEMIRVGNSQGWISIRILHELAEIFEHDRTGSPLANELRRAQWRTRMGGMFAESLRAIPARVRHKGSVKKMEALAESLEADPTGGHERIAALSRESYHEYAMELERQSSRVSVVLVTAACVMVIGFICCLKIPFLA